MCGLFGAIGKGINPLIIRALAIANRSRGKESLGMFDSSGKKVKSASDPTECLTRPNFSAFIARKHWFIAGHTRKATRGNINKKNAHPFRYGQYVGSHNGQVTAPATYDVDSQYLIDQLNKHTGNYAEAFKGISGYWALTWFDGTHFYIQAHDNRLTLARKGNTWYYSSDKDHLNAAIGKGDEWLTLEDGATIRFAANGKMEKLEAFKSEAGRGGYRKAATTGYSYKPAPGSGIIITRPTTSSQNYRNGYDGAFSPDLPGSGYHRAMSNYNTTLNYREFDEAQEWALELGYNGFYDYMKSNVFYGEYGAYACIAREVRNQEDQECKDKLYEEWDAEYEQAQIDADSEDVDFPTFEEWLEAKEEADIMECDKFGDDGDMDFYQQSAMRDARKAKQLRIGFDSRDMDNEFDRLCDRDDATKFIP